MKNINVDGIAVMTGKRWVATPFVLNYGFNHFMEDNYIEESYSKKEGIVRLNYFGQSKREYQGYIRKYASPKTYAKSFHFGDMRHCLIGAPVKEYNVIQMLFYGKMLRIATAWLDTADEDVNKAVNKDDFNLLAKIPLKSMYQQPKLVTCCVMLWKYTAELYRRNLCMRFEEGLKGYDLTYNGVIRMDGGMDEDTERFEQFSVMKTMKINPSIAGRCSRIIPLLHFEEQ